jgi:hypothetical protein
MTFTPSTLSVTSVSKLSLKAVAQEGDGSELAPSFASPSGKIKDHSLFFFADGLVTVYVSRL